MNKYEIIDLANQFRSNWNLNLTGQIDIIKEALFNIKNLILVFLPMPKDINGSCFKFLDEKIIFINVNDSEIQQRFTIACEIYHLEFGESDFNFKFRDGELTDADLFAQYLLLPDISLDNIDLNNLVELEQRFMIPHREILKRLNLSFHEFDSRKVAAKLGLNTRLYEPYTAESISIGHYVCLAENLFDLGLISKGKKEEFLNQAYCYKLVFS